MRIKRLPLFFSIVVLVVALASGILSTGGTVNLVGLIAQPTPTPAHPNPGPQPFADAYKVAGRPLPNIVVPGGRSPLLPHPCGGVAADPPFSGVSPLSIAYVPGMCNWGYGDIAVWQAGGHSYVAQSGFELRMYFIWNVDDPYNPVLLFNKGFPTGGSASTAIFHFHQFGHEYMATTMRGTGTGCGYFIDNVDNPSNPVPVVTNFNHPGDWCNVHETFVSTDANGDADYAWLTMGIESEAGAGSGYKIVAVTLPNLSQSNVLTETGRYQRPDSCGGLCIFAHDSNVVGNRVYIAHWQGGAIIEDKETLAHNVNPTPLNALNSIQPSSFWVHHLVPTTDNKFLAIEDEFLNQPTAEKIKFYNIQDLSNPVYAGGITGGDANSNMSQAHNQIIKNLGPHHDLLLSAFYLAGYRLYDLDTSGSTPVITQVGSHQLRATGGPNFGGVWGVDSMPCTVRGVQTTCIYSSDMAYGLIVDALGVNPAFDPYPPDTHITSPIQGQEITTCSVTVQGTGHDYWSGLSQVRFQVTGNNGQTWQYDAQGTTNWTYQWNITVPPGQYVLQSRGIDMGNNIEIPGTSITVHVTANCPAAPPMPPAKKVPVPSKVDPGK